MLLPAKCPECGGLIEVNSEQKAANCKFCGSAFIVEEAVNNFNTYFNVTNIYNTSHNYGDGAVVNVYEDKNKDFVIEGGVLKEYKGESLTPVIPEGVVAIAGGVFRDSMITKVSFPSTLKELRFFYESPDIIGPFYGCKSLKEVNLPEGIKSIPCGCFRYCASLTSITIPDSVTKIEAHAFWGCENLESIKIPNSVTDIANYAFYGCKNLKSITLPNNVTGISSSVFQGCENLTAIDIPKGVTYIGESAFSGCENLTSVDIPMGVETIGEMAFSRCTSLTSITIPNSVKNIRRLAFWRCTNLKSVVIPKSVMTIEEKAFEETLYQKDVRKRNGLC